MVQHTAHGTTVSSKAPDAETFREVMGRFPSGVAVVAAAHGGHDHGMAVSSVTSLSVAPPTLLVCVNRDAHTHRAIAAAGCFGVSVLNERQEALARRFATRDEAKFDGVPREHTRTLGVPVLPEALAWLECRVTAEVDGGTHTVFVGEVTEAVARSGYPLTYFRSGFGRLLEAVERAL
jgi:flavin reductase (DIM6/NTAB) family NADH-FMN oxidoreductase RutF